MAARFADAIGLQGEAHAYFRQLVLLGQAKDSVERAQAFKRFLAARFKNVRIRTHTTFQADDRKWCDVAVLDWHQGGAGLGSRPKSPLGRRGDWNRPVVMIGSAGLNTAMSWEVFGGSG